MRPFFDLYRLVPGFNHLQQTLIIRISSLPIFFSAIITRLNDYRTNPGQRDKCVNEIILCAPILGISTLTK